MLKLKCFKNEFQKTLNLKAPSWVFIAKSMSDLKAIASDVIGKFYQTKSDFNITRIDYLPITEGYACKVFYKLSDEHAGVFGLCRFENYKVSQGESDSEIIYTIQKNESKGGFSVNYQCKGSSCTGGCGVKSIIYRDGRIETTCTCANCEMIMTIEEPSLPTK